MKFVVTGAAGYIGSQLCKELSKSEENYIVAIDRNEINHSFLNKKFILDFNNIYPKDLFLEVDCVIHLGGSSLIGPSLNNPKKSYEDNLLGSIKLLNSCLKNNVKNIIFASSASVYGNNENNKIFSENDECKPLSPYARSKFFMNKVSPTDLRLHSLIYITMFATNYNVFKIEKGLGGILYEN